MSIENRKYQFRNFPCNVVSDDELWSVCGEHNGGSGVLEWCVSKEDAEYRMKLMKMDKRFGSLSVEKFDNGGVK